MSVEAHEKRVVHCLSCKARIIFLHTAAGKKIPIDADTVDEEDEVYEGAKHVVHWSTCDNPDRFRKPRK
jgi:transcriptional regulator of met regulon